MTKTAAIILANELSKELPEDKGTTLLGDKPLIRHVFNSVKSIVDEVIIVANTWERAEKYAAILPKAVQFVVDESLIKNALSGVIAGFEATQGKYALLLSYDSPFVSKELSVLLLDLAVGKTAVVPRNANTEIEPLCAVYQTKIVLEVAKKIVKEGATDLQTLVETLHSVRYISKMIVEQIDPQLQSFFSINSLLDLKRATLILKEKSRLINKQ